jgi:hypothetical protein
MIGAQNQQAFDSIRIICTSSARPVLTHHGHGFLSLGCVGPFRGRALRRAASRAMLLRSHPWTVSIITVLLLQS